MGEKWRLKRTEQCKLCPWLTSVDPYDIPDYNREYHLSLSRTIVNHEAPWDDYLSILVDGSELRAMACHESKDESEHYCIGWMHNQLGDGNNIALRMKMASCENGPIRLIGEQHPCFDDTIPEPRESEGSEVDARGDLPKRQPSD